ncbi:MAG: hypothetical protein ACRBK7_04240 [Acidimicrobiales bacterium]
MAPWRSATQSCKAIVAGTLVLGLSSCALLEADRPEAALVETRIAECLGVQARDVNFSWGEDGMDYAVDLKKPDRFDMAQRLRCYEQAARR